MRIILFWIGPPEPSSKCGGASALVLIAPSTLGLAPDLCLYPQGRKKESAVFVPMKSADSSTIVRRPSCRHFPAPLFAELDR